MTLTKWFGDVFAIAKRGIRNPHLFVFNKIMVLILAEINGYRIRHYGGSTFLKWQDSYCISNVYTFLLLIFVVLYIQDDMEIFVVQIKRMIGEMQESGDKE